MPQSFGMPDDNDLASTFSVEYLRAWKTDRPCTEALEAPQDHVDLLPKDVGMGTYDRAYRRQVGPKN